VALNCCVPPTLTDALVGATVIDVTTGVTPLTLKAVTALFPLNEAVMFTVPEDTPVTRPGFDCPVDSTEATAELEEDQAAEAVTSCCELSL